MSDKNNGGPAFPSNNHPSTQSHEAVLGMTLRDWFAGQVNVDTDLSKQFATKIVGRVCPEWQIDPLGTLKFWAEVEAVLRGIKADAMLKERDK